MGLDTVETILWAEKEFGVDIPDADAAEIRTVGEFSAFIRTRLLVRDGIHAPSEPAVFERIKRFLVTEFHMPPERVVRTAEFVRDLGLE